MIGLTDRTSEDDSIRSMLDMDTQICNKEIFVEEGDRSREIGWFGLKALSQAQLSFDWRHGKVTCLNIHIKMFS